MKQPDITTNHSRPSSKDTFLGLLLSILLSAILLAGCKKDDNNAHNTVADGSTINYVLKDNFNFAGFYVLLSNLNVTDSLGKKGPLTVFAPDNNAFVQVNIPPPFPANLFFYYYTRQQLLNRVRYYTVDEAIAVKKLPLVKNKAYLTRTGGYIYISKYLNGSDTVVTANGIKLSSTDNAASNGVLQVLPQVINPEINHTLSDYLHTDTTITLFAAAMMRSGLEASLLKGKDPYTIIALSNTAMQASGKLGKNLGISKLDSILKADPNKLASIMKNHIISGMNFEGDLYRQYSANPLGITTLSGSKIIIGGNPNGLHAMTFKSAGNSSPATIAPPVSYNPTANYANIPCGNGVVHIINKVLIP